MKKTAKKKVVAPPVVPAAKVAKVAKVLPGAMLVKKGGTIKSKKC